MHICINEKKTKLLYFIQIEKKQSIYSSPSTSPTNSNMYNLLYYDYITYAYYDIIFFSFPCLGTHYHQLLEPCAYPA